MGELGRAFGDRLKKHLRALSPIYQQSLYRNVDSFSIVGREAHAVTRTIKETMFIKVNDPPLNRNQAKYHLPYIWDEGLQDTLALYLR